MKLFGLSTVETGSVNTAKEIDQQPQLWLETFEMLKEQKESILAFINEKVVTKQARIIFTGAGTSAYVGDTAAPWVRRNCANQLESIATTDIVSNPLNYLKTDVPTVLVSFARSGNSPESIGAYNLANELVKDIAQIIITCNPEGELSKRAQADPNSLVLIMPEGSNDKGFAMTSSFSCMYLTSLLLFQLDHLEDYESSLSEIVKNAESIFESKYKDVAELVQLEKKKVVYLGSSSLKGLAKEACLKHLELTGGLIPTFWESVLGFRHGPKSIVDDSALIFVFISNDSYTRQYELDLLRELKNDGGEKVVVAMTYSPAAEVVELCDKVLVMNEQSQTEVEDCFVVFNYLVYAQLFALFNSIHLGISPDNPSPTGMVNRVVKGVTLYPFNQKK